MMPDTTEVDQALAAWKQALAVDADKKTALALAQQARGQTFTALQTAQQNVLKVLAKHSK